MRPPDGRCARCHRSLPPEHLRVWLVQGTDVCMKCGHAKAQREAGTPQARVYFDSWWQRLDSWRQVVARVR